MRLTKKSDKLGYCLRNSHFRVNQCWKKLGHLEDVLEKYNLEDATDLDLEIRANRDKVYKYENIEKELGIDLITLIKAISNGVWVKTKNDISKHLTVALKKRHHTKEYWLFYRPYSHIYLKDYGKTWALTREELEK